MACIIVKAPQVTIDTTSLFIKSKLLKCIFLKCLLCINMYNIYRVSLVAQMVKNLPVIQETPVPFLGQKDPLENG